LCAFGQQLLPSRTDRGIRLSTATGDISGGPKATLRGWLSSRDVRHYVDLITVLIGKEFRVRYKSTVLGYAWSVLHPLAFAMVFFVLFTYVARFDDVSAYMVYLIAGLFPWQCLSNTMGTANFYFLGNSSLIKKVKFNRATLVVAGVLNETIHFAVSIPVIMCFMLWYGRSPSLSWLWQVPLILLIQTVMAIGLALTVATCNVFFRDLERLTTIAMHLLFYATPILYPVQRLAELPKGARFALLWLNPFTPLIQCWHGVFYDGVVEPQYIVGAAVWAALSLCVGVPVYRAMVWRFAEIV
jgi:lipopolysaccharide transport system permease protein